MARTKREDFVGDLATELFVEYTKSKFNTFAEINFREIAKMCTNASSDLYDILMEKGLVK